MLFRSDEIEYVIAAIPLGGYVKMLDEREGSVSESDKKRAFNNASLSKRIAIVFAGPAFNFILAIFLYWVVFMLGATVERPYIGETVKDSIAAQAGFEVKDEVLQVGNTAVPSWNDFRLEILNQGLDGGNLQIRVLATDGVEYTRQLALGDMRLLENEGDIFQYIGFTHWRPQLKAEIAGVIAEGAAESAGLKEGDLVVSVDGIEVDRWMTLVDMIREKPNMAMNFIVLREGVELPLTIIPNSRKIKDGEQGYIGAYQHIPEEVRQQLVTRVEYSVTESMNKAVVKTWDMSSLTLRVLWKMVAGEASLSNISGPITIATYAGITASIGLVSFFSFLAIISVSLGVLNLLPIPMLDGGHLLYYFIEIIKGSPVSEEFELRGQQVGIVLLGLLMSVAIFNDIQRLI